MSRNRHLPALAVVAAGITMSGLALTSVPASAATTTPDRGPAVHTRSHTKSLSSSRLAQVRQQQHEMATDQKAPTFTKAGSKTFTVNTTEDSPLANPAGTSCVDAASAKCSLRAAVEAANNRTTPVRIVLGKHTYTLSTATALTVTNAHGVSVVGQGAHTTAIAGDGSGLFYVDAGTGPGSLFLSDLKLKNGTSSTGGAVQLADDKGGTLALDHVIATHNTASNAGGAIYAYDFDAVYISDSKFIANQAYQGGAIYQYWADVQIQNTSFTDNSTIPGSYGYGGAVYNDYGVFDMVGGSISGNTAGDGVGGFSGDGGAIYDEYTLTTLSKVHLDGNTADANGEGGAIYADEDALDISGGSISHNRATGTDSSGGGIYGDYQNQISLRGVTMAGNRTDGSSDGYGGGAIYMYGYEYPSQLVIQGGKISGSNNSAVYLYGYDGGVDASITGATLTNNTDNSNNGMDSLGCGGAVCVYGYEYGGMNLEMTGNRVTGNTSAGNYGAGAVGVYTYDYSTASIALRKNTFSGNATGASGYGGAVGLYSDGWDQPISARLAGNTFTKNRAGTQAGYGYGGALSAYYYVTVKDNGSTFSHNSARGDGAYGGAVSLYEAYSSSSWNRTKFIGNSAGTNADTNSGYGGGVYSSNYYGDAFTQVTMAGNKAASAGGGFYGDGDAYQPSFKASTISGNTAGSPSHEGYGGGIYADDAVLAVQNSTLTGNRALSGGGNPGQGGAIWYSDGRLGLRYSTVSGNYAKQGAGLYGNVYGTILSSIVSKNKTSPSGSEQDCAVSDPSYRLQSLGGNVLGKANCVSALVGSDKVTRKLHLGKLKDNGGATRTMAISAKSPAVGRATYLIPASDQRGHQRPANHADAGAFELPKVKKHHR